jgi:glutamyl endopeptidase
MTKWVRSGAMVLAVAGLVAELGLATATARPAPSPARPEVRALSRPRSIDPAVRGLRFSPSSPGTGTSSPSIRRVVNDGAIVKQPVKPGSVIGTDDRTQVADTTAYPARAIGQIELTFDGFSQYICTGWLIDSNTILSAGHCGYEPSATGGTIIASAQFYPGRNALVDPNGGCNVVGVYSPDGWKIDGKPSSDWSLMQLDCTIGDTVGWFGYQWLPRADGLTGLKVRIQGYPGDKASGTQWTMSGKIATSTKTMAFYSIDTYGGQSGSPVFKPNMDTCGVCGLAIHTYGVGLPGAGATRNAGTRISKGRFLLIADLANDNDPVV